MKKRYVIYDLQFKEWVQGPTTTIANIQGALIFTSKRSAQVAARAWKFAMEYPGDTPLVEVRTVFLSHGVIL